MSTSSAFPKRRNREARAFVRAHACVLYGRFTRRQLTPNDLALPGREFWRHICWGPRDAAHVDETQARGAGDLGQTIPLCRAAHRVLDRIKRARFEEATGLDLVSIAAGLGLKFSERGGALA